MARFLLLIPTLPARLSVDEKAFRNGHDYMAIVSAPTTNTVLEVADGRTKASLGKFVFSR